MNLPLKGNLQQAKQEEGEWKNLMTLFDKKSRQEYTNKSGATHYKNILLGTSCNM